MSTDLRRESFLDRQHLLELNTAGAQQAFLQARQKGVARPVILIVDMGDRLGRVIADHACGAEAANAHREAMARANLRPTLTLALEHEAAVDLLADTAPNARAALGSPQPAGFARAVVMAEGGNLYAGLPVPE